MSQKYPPTEQKGWLQRLAPVAAGVMIFNIMGLTDKA